MQGFIAALVLAAVCLEDGHAVPLTKTVEASDASEDAAMAPLIDTIILPNSTVKLAANVDAVQPVKITIEVAPDAPAVRVLVLPWDVGKKCRETRDGPWRKACSRSSRTSTHCFFYD